MALEQSIEARRAYRALASTVIDKDILIRLVQAAHSAPSSGNNQPWRVITVTEVDQLARLKSTLSSGNYWALNAPAIAAFVTNPSWSMRMAQRDFAFFELGMAAMAYQIQATAERLVAHPMAGFNADEAKKILGISSEDVLEILMAVAYRGDESKLSAKHVETERSPRSRKPLQEVASFDRWEEHLRPAAKA